MRVGTIKTCGNCGRKSYIPEGENCPVCGKNVDISTKQSGLTIIVPLGNAEISRRTVEQLYNEGYIDDPRRN